MSSTISTRPLIVVSSSEPRFSGSSMSLCMILIDAFDTVVDVHEATGLFAVAPDFDFFLAGFTRINDLAANRGRRFFASAIPGAVRTIDVMEPRHARYQAVVLAEVAAHPFGEQLLPTVTIFWHCRIGVVSLSGTTSSFLLVRVVDARAAGVEEPTDFGFVRGLKQVRVDQHAQHAQRIVIFDEAHAAHIGGQVVDLTRPAAGRRARIANFRSATTFSTSSNVGTILEWLDIHAANPREALSRSARPDVLR